MKVLRLLPLLLLLGFVVATSRAEVCTGNEAWIPVGTALSGSPQSAVEMKGDLYVLAREADGKHAIVSWNGQFWNNVVTIADGLSTADRLAVYNDELYITGFFESLGGVAGTRGIAKWNGSTWESVDGGVAGWIQTVEVYNGELYVAGSFQKAGDASVRSIARWNGSAWQAVDEGVESSVQSMAVHQGELYVAGGIQMAGGQNVKGVARWNGSEWSPVGDGVGGSIDGLLSYKDELYAYGPSIFINGVKDAHRLVRWDGSQWKSVEGSWTMPSGSMIVFEGELHAAGWNSFGRDTVIRDSGAAVAAWNGEQWRMLSGFNNASLSVDLIVYQGELYAYGDFTSSCGTEVKHIARLCTDKNCARVTGNVYHDVDGDCMNDPTEEGLRGRIVEILPGPQYAATDKEGNYSHYLDFGSYTVSLAPYKYWNQTCPVGTQSVTLSQPGEVVSGKNFATLPIPGIRDLRVSLAGGRPRPGFRHTYVIKYENVGTEPLSGTIRFEHDPILVLDSTRVEATRYTPSVAEWDFTKLGVGESGDILVYMTVPAATTLGTKVCSHLSVDLDGGGDELLRDNSDSLCEEVRGSYDPNDITVSPLGNMEDEEYRLAPSDTILSYMIRFQNTGTDTAFKVVVVDTLSTEQLNMKTVELGAASHAYTFGMSGNGILTWTFDGIMLPDSNVNEVGSHGYLKYTVHLQRGLAPSTAILNRGHIYFDYNSPVTTNTAVSVTAGTSSAPIAAAAAVVKIYPNPAVGTVVIEGDIDRGTIVTLSNTIGREMRRQVCDASGRAIVEVAGLPIGTYVLRVQTRHGVTVERVNIVR